MKKTIVFAIIILALTASCDNKLKSRKSIKNPEREQLPVNDDAQEEDKEDITEWMI